LSDWIDDMKLTTPSYLEEVVPELYVTITCHTALQFICDFIK